MINELKSQNSKLNKENSALKIELETIKSEN